MKMALKQEADEYFSKLNSIARRMYDDMHETKQAYEDLWGTISEKEQKEILSESIITPEALLKYKPKKTRAVQEFAAKLIVDDHCSYNDEHSGPFSFKTKSQRNLCLFQRETEAHEPRKMLKTKPKMTLESLRVDQDVSDFKDTESNSSTLPKTGLDFLDNW